MRLRIHVEGPTEEAFVNRLLAPYLGKREFVSVEARIMGRARQRRQRGGVPPWTSFRDELIRQLKEDRDLLHTSMVDFYGMPAEGRRAWPGRKEAGEMPQDRKGQHVAQQMLADLRAELPRVERFLPFVTMHEFEALLFSDSEAFARALEKPKLAEPMLSIRGQFKSPEHINDGSKTAPSKRILALHPRYAKVAEGTAAAEEVTLPRIIEQCGHFANWLRRLETLARHEMDALT